MRIVNHRLHGATYKPARHIGGNITPTAIVVHDTASRIDPGKVASYLRNNDREVSVHFVVERDGHIEQQAPCNRKCNHAGKSILHGRKWCNNFTIGIEIVNAGKMSVVDKAQGMGRAWFGKVYDNCRYASTKEHGSGMWMLYTPEQIQAVIDICRAIHKKYGISLIVPHWYISPGRKVDTNPLFPLEHVRSAVLGRSDTDDDDANMPSGEQRPILNDAVVRVIAQHGLNMRRWPSFNPNVITVIPEGAKVPVRADGVFREDSGKSRKWLKVSYNSQEGWIVDHPAYVSHEML